MLNLKGKWPSKAKQTGLILGSVRDWNCQHPTCAWYHTCTQAESQLFFSHSFQVPGTDLFLHHPHPKPTAGVEIPPAGPDNFIHWNISRSLSRQNEVLRTKSLLGLKKFLKTQLWLLILFVYPAHSSSFLTKLTHKPEPNITRTKFEAINTKIKTVASWNCTVC